MEAARKSERPPRHEHGGGEAALGLIAVGTSILLGGLTLLLSADGVVAAMAAFMTHAGLLCVVTGTWLLRQSSSASIRIVYSITCGLLVFCVAGIDLAIILGL